MSLFAGATREIGVCLNRVVIRHRAMESRMKTLCSALLDCLVTPLQDRLDEWRRTAVALDKGGFSCFPRQEEDQNKNNFGMPSILPVNCNRLSSYCYKPQIVVMIDIPSCKNIKISPFNMITELNITYTDIK